MSEPIPFPRHKWRRCAGHDPWSDAQDRCPYCSWGAARCTTCGAIEGELTADCPQRLTTPAERQAVLKGEVDFTRQLGWHRPTRRCESAGGYDAS